MNNKNELHIRLPSRIITKLGGALYGGFIPAICETISNSYDADATLVTIESLINNNEYEIRIEDNGVGMSWDTLKDSFFEAGNNRRTRENQGKTKKGRLVTGKKGLGKFALFGLCEEIYIETSDGKHTNAFSVNINDLENSNETEYALVPLKYNQPTQDGKSYTKIILKKLLKKFRGLASLDSLARRINYVFKNQDDEFLIKLITPDGEEILDKEKRQTIVRGERDDDQRILYNIPDSLSEKDEPNKIKLEQSDITYIKDNNIRGFLVARKGTTKIAEQKGLAIFSRGKICQDPSYFDIQPGNSYGYAYLYGELEIDFLDASDNEDYISTNRKEIEWDKNQDLEKLRGVINRLLKRYAEAYDIDKKVLDGKMLKQRMHILGVDPKWSNQYRLDKQTKAMLEDVTKMFLQKKIEKNTKYYENKIKKNVALLQNLATQRVLINEKYVQNTIKLYPQIKKFYNEALSALATGDVETVIIKANAMRDGVREHFPHTYQVFTSAIKHYKEMIENPEARGALISLLEPLQKFSTEKQNPIERLRSNTKTAHNTSKNSQFLDNKHIAELVLNYVFMYTGFVLGNPELFLEYSNESRNE